MKKQVLCAIAVASCAAIGSAAPAISNLTDNRSSYTGSQVPLYEKFEITFDLNTIYSNPFDTNQIAVDCTLTSPTSRVLVQPGFFFEDYVRSGSGAGETVDVVPNSRHWKVRFAPREAGNYNYTLKVKDSSGTTTTNGSVTTTANGSGRGFLKRNGNRLAFDNGQPYYAIGTDSPWFQPGTWGDGTYGADADYGQQNTFGGNWDRLWIDVGDWASPSIEAQRTFWNFWTPNGSASRDTTAGAAHSGTVAAKFNFTGNQTTDNLVRWSKTQNWKVTAGVQYTFTVWIKCSGVSAASGGGAYVFDNYFGQCPATPASGTTSWTQYSVTFTPSTSGRLNPELHFKNATGTCWFDDLSLKQTGTSAELGEDTGFERGVLQEGIYNLDESWKLDYVLDTARTKGVQVMLMVGRNGDAWSNYQRYMRYLIARWGYNTAVAAWEMCNENCFNFQLSSDWSTWVSQNDPYDHPRTTSFWNQSTDYTIWPLQKMDVVQMHRYVKDAPAGTDWSLSGSAAFNTGTKHSGSRSVKLTGNGGDAGTVSMTSGARPGNYTLNFWACGTNVTQVNWTAPAGMVTFYGTNGSALATFPTNANQNSTDLNGTYAWKQLTYNCVAPAGTASLKLEGRGGYMTSGAILYFDELSLKDPDGKEVPLDYNFEVTDYFDDFAMVLVREGKFLSGAGYGKPIWWGELGIEDHTEPNGSFLKSPYHDQDTNGIIFHQILWGSTVSGSQSTGPWWYLHTNYTHFTALKNFMNAVGTMPTNLASVSYLDRNPEITATDSRIRACAFKNSTNGIAYVYHKDYTWGQVVKNHVTPTGISGASITIGGLTAATYSYRWWSPQSGSQLSSNNITITNSTMTLSLPATLDKDFALYFTQTTSGPTPPAAPSNLSATALSSSSIQINWTDNANNEIQFKIERKTGAGGTYSQIATTAVNVTTFTDSGLSANTTYYYRVRANNSAGDSAYSNEANATTQGGLPGGWSNGDIGAVGAAGSAGYSSGIFTVTGSGADIWGNADEFQFVRQTLNGDGTIIARVVSVQNTDPWAKAGVMMRETLNADSKHCMVVVSAASGVAFQRRVATAGVTTHTAGPSAAAPYWVKLVRSGNIFTASSSSNGTSWVTIGTETNVMAVSIYVGLAVTSHADGTLCTATFDNVSVSGSAVGVSFSGATNSYGSVADAAVLDIVGSAVTMEAFVKVTALPAAGALGTVMARELGGSSGYSLLIGGDGHIQVRLGTSGNSWGQLDSGALMWNSGQWYHVAASYDGSTIRIFRDGTQITSAAQSGTLLTGANALYFGGKRYDWSNADFLNAVIDEARVSKIARYTANFGPPTAPFSTDSNTVGLWHFNENTGTTSADASGNGLTATLNNATWNGGKF